jgi:hypothetical protein
MSKFDSHKWTRQYKEALIEKKKKEEKDEYKGYEPDPSDDNIKKKGQAVHSKDLLHTTKVDGKKADKVGMKLGSENDLPIEKDKDGLDVYASGLKEDYSTMRLKSNIAQKWRSDRDMVSDLRQWFEATALAGGYDLADDIVSALEVEARYAREYLRKNSRAIRNRGQ